jgi:aminoglycoside phosphotransferase (APT) family kinase protein
MNNVRNSLEQISDKLLAYLRTKLNNTDVSYDISLTPMVGGYEAFTYRFKLKGVQSELDKPLVLRLFQEYRNPEQAISEGAVQNALAAQGYPVPSVWFTSTDKAYISGAFLIMDFLPGETMLTANVAEMPSMLGKAHAVLHNLDPTPLRKTLNFQGFIEQRYQLSGRLKWLTTKSKILPWLEESVQWLIENRPPEPDNLVICHGDFHPMNILVKNGKVTGVLDWPGFMIGDAIMDVAFTKVLCTIAARHLLPTQNWDEVISRYLAEYRIERFLDMTYLDYYRTLKCIIALVDGAEGQEAWISPSALESLAKHIHDITKIRVALPGQTNTL